MVVPLPSGPGDGPPILWSFRRCPYAIRARLALATAAIAVELREVNLGCKPPELLEASASGTVPVLVTPAASLAQPADGPAPPIDMPAPPLVESLDIMRWALEHHDPGDWLRQGDADAQARMQELLAACDGPFKHHLDRFKYASRHAAADPEVHRRAGLALLRDWNARLTAAAAVDGAIGWLLGPRSCLADWALLPFVRQFRLADPAAFAAATDLAAVQVWLERFQQGPELAAVLAEPWGPRSPWRSPRWLYHLALPEDWAEALPRQQYRRSSRGLSLEQVGFIHASYAHQLGDTFRRFYADLPRVLLLTLDPQRLAAAGVAVRAEAAPGGQELFPHLYGPLPLTAVLAVENWRPAPRSAP
ncbi:MAG: DUF952 domain-containing protein [Cyanobium sp.]